MREIKFRAWDKERRIMYYPKILGFDYNGDLIFIDTNNEYLNHTRDSSFIKLMQYTGIKDKNGKEIYEGDIVLQTVSNKKFIVKYDYDWCGFSPFISCYQGYKVYKVIGNIYENPELLEGK